MSLTVLEQITRVLRTRLELLLNQSTYNTNVCEVIRPVRFEDYTPKHLQIVLTKGADEVDEELSYPGNPPSVAHKVTFNIRCHVMTDEEDCDPIDYVVDMFAADVQRVVVGTDSTWHTFGNLAVHSEFGNYEPIAAEGGIDGVNVPVLITFRHSEGNPYEVRA